MRVSTGVSTVVLCTLLVILVMVGWVTAFAADGGAGQLGQRTRAPGGVLGDGAPTNQRPTLDSGAAQATAQAVATSAVDWSAQVPGAEQTAQALLDTVIVDEFNPDAAVATFEAFATQTGVDPSDVEVVIDALLAEIPAEWAAYADLAELEAALNQWLMMGNVSAEWQGNTLALTATYSETGFNALIDAALWMGGYAISDANVDLVPGGMVIDVYGFTTPVGQAGTLSAYVLMSAVNGRVEAELVSASFNGRDVPLPTLSEWETMQAEIAAVVSQTVMQTYTATYSVNALIISDTDITISLTASAVVPAAS
ncbi:MAG: hypothetical protein JW966_02515 [Anaerolineae bacterium]|nr:hypothetical protein [Anaerolineae bacterium]